MPKDAQCEWRRSKADAILDAESMGWKPNEYKLETTYFDTWEGNRQRWWKARKLLRVRNGGED